MTRIFLVTLFALGGVAFIGSCKNPAAPREPNKFASQATFIRRLDSVSIEGQSILLTRGKTSDGLFLRDQSGYLFVGDLQLGTSNNTALFLTRTNALGKVLWTRVYETNLTIFPKTILQEDNGFVIGGTSLNPATRTDAYLLKLNNDFDKVWSRSHDLDSTLQEVNGLLTTNSNRYILFGRASREVIRQLSPTNIIVYFIADGYVASCDANGNLISQRRIRSLGSMLNINGSDINFNSGSLTPFNLILSGFYTPVAFSTSALARDLYLLRIGATGDTTHFIYDSFSVGGDVGSEELANAKRNVADEAFSTLVSPSGEVLTFGKTNSTFFVLKTDATVGIILDKFFFPVPTSASLNQAILSRDGGFVVVGASTQKITFSGTRSPAPGGRDVFIAKYSSQGALLWEITQGTSFDDEGLRIKQTLDGGYIITGTSNNKPLLLKVDERGLLAE